ncbi:ribonuclease P protein component [Nocardia gipuzkoensis]|uniref:ribonuclease P protein component n=1 Tax=Nocardia gipuzkoensis TaxID=2749991 RepID=UPI001E41FEA7|nr:ribonuclease P protein component [Nocardia gipuzkoensis]UGT70783.1 ribonuclease P protein component [Nocardia gipuzkoensis]
MLPEPYRLHHRADFSRTVRRGQRIGRRDLVVHALVHEYDGGMGAKGRHDQIPDDVLVRVGGPRFGLIVSKAVGNAVIRHRVARRLRHMCAQVVDEVPPGTDVVIRALPGAATASSEDLLRQLRTALRKLGVGAAAGVATGGSV